MSKPSTSTRSQATGRQLSRTALRAIRKNTETVEETLTLATKASSADEFYETMTAAALDIGKITAQRGGGRIEVQMADASTQNVRIAGNITFHGKAGSKTDRDNCMIVGALVIIRGGQAAARLGPAAADRLGTVYRKLGLKAPKNFFKTGVIDEEDDDDGWEWDRSDEEKKGAAASDDEDEDVDVDAI